MKLEFIVESCKQLRKEADAMEQRDAALCSLAGECLLGLFSDAGFLKAFAKVRWLFAHVASSPLHQPGASSTPNLLFIFLAQLCGTAVQPPSWLTFAPSRAESLS